MGLNPILAAQDAGCAAEHPTRGDAQAVVPHGLGDAGGAAGGHSIGCLRGDVARGEAGAAGGQDQVHLSAVGQPDELGLQRLGLIGQDAYLSDVASFIFHHRSGNGNAANRAESAPTYCRRRRKLCIYRRTGTVHVWHCFFPKSSGIYLSDS